MQNRIILTFIVSLIFYGPFAPSSKAQQPEDQLGNWLIFNSNIRFSKHWVVFAESHVRLFEVRSNLDEILLRPAVHYFFTPSAMVGLGYLYAPSWPYEDSLDTGHDRIENRLYQQLSINHKWARANFEHRYRIEQRWIQRYGVPSYSNRVRYRLQITTPLNKGKMERAAWFINWYNEFFINVYEERWLYQNRYYYSAPELALDTSCSMLDSRCW